MRYESDNQNKPNLSNPLDADFRPLPPQPLPIANLETDFVLSQMISNIPAWETKRAEQNQAYNRFWWIALFVFLGGTLLSIGAFFIHPVIGVILLIVVLFFTYLRGKKATDVWNEFATVARNQIFTPLIQNTLPNTEYVYNNYISQQDFSLSELYSGGNEFAGEDYIKGNLQGTAFKCSQLKVVKRSTSRDSKGNTKTNRTTIFSGMFIILDTPNIANGMIQIKPDIAERYFGGMVGGFLQKLVGSTTAYPLIKFDEDPEFEKQFVVYSNDTATARRLLTADARAYLQQLNEGKNNKKISLAISNHKVYLGINNGQDFLPIRINQPLTEESVKAYLEEWLSILRIIQQLIRFLR